MLNRRNSNTNYAFKMIDLNPSIIGSTIILYAKNKVNARAQIVTVDFYSEKIDSVTGKLVEVTLNEITVVPANTTFSIVENEESIANFDPDFMSENMTVGEAGFDFVGNKVTFRQYREGVNKIDNKPITGRVEAIELNKDGKFTVFTNGKRFVIDAEESYMLTV